MESGDESDGFGLQTKGSKLLAQREMRIDCGMNTVSLLFGVVGLADVNETWEEPDGRGCYRT